MVDALVAVIQDLVLQINRHKEVSMNYSKFLVVILVPLLLMGCTYVAPTDSNNTTPSSIYPTINTTEDSAQPIVTTQPTTSPPAPVHDDSPLRFLTDLNLNGSLYPSEEMVPPGTLPELDEIPPYDQDLIGEKVSITLAGDQLRTSFYYRSGENERLALVIGEFNIPLLMVFETNLGGVEALCQKLAAEESFEATILAAVNISFQEGMYARNVATTREDFPVYEQFDLDSGVIPTAGGEYIGIVGLDDKTIVKCIKGSQTGDPSDMLVHAFDIFYRIFDRFDLNQYLE